MENYNENDLIKGIIENMTFVKNQPPKDGDKCAGSIRSALENAVKLFWLKKYENVPVWIKGDHESFDLYEAISDPKFSKCFDKITISYMHTIRTRCNQVLHGGSPLTVNETTELLSMLDKCIRSIEQAIPLTFLSPLPSKTTPHEAPFSQRKQNNIHSQQQGLKSYTAGDLFKGNSNIDMFYKVCGTYPEFNRCWIALKDLGYSDRGILWVVYMDGTPHGPSRDYLWVNRISSDSETIEEEYVKGEYVGVHKHRVTKYVAKDEIRVGFRRDPLGEGEANLCECVGVFQISEYRDTATGFIRVYKRISNNFPL